MRLPEDPDFPPQINIVPMIDVIFAVLVFFILSSLFLTRSEGLPVNLPTAESGVSQAQRSTTLTIDAAGNLYLAQQPIGLEQLVETLQGLLPQEGDFLVVVRADAQVPHGRVVAAMDELRSLKRVQLAIATQPSPP